MTVDGEGAFIDLDRGFLSVPFYGAFRISHTTEQTVFFEADKPDVYVFGSIDRTAGKLLLSVVTQAERRKMKAGEPFQAKSAMDVTCIPARRMF